MGRPPAAMKFSVTPRPSPRAARSARNAREVLRAEADAVAEVEARGRHGRGGGAPAASGSWSVHCSWRRRCRPCPCTPSRSSSRPSPCPCRCSGPCRSCRRRRSSLPLAGVDAGALHRFAILALVLLVGPGGPGGEHRTDGGGDGGTLHGFADHGFPFGGCACDGCGGRVLRFGRCLAPWPGEEGELDGALLGDDLGERLDARQPAVGVLRADVVGVAVEAGTVARMRMVVLSP